MLAPLIFAATLPPFDPNQANNLVAWYSADAGLYKDSGFTTPAVANVDPVGGWRDRSPNGNNLVQATSGNRPALATGFVNSRPAVSFAGGVVCIGQSPKIILGTTWSVFLAYRPGQLAVGGNVILGSNSPTNNYVLDHDNAFMNTYDGTNATQSDADGMSLNTWYVLGCRRNGNTVRFYKNGAALGADKTLSGSVSQGFNNVSGFASNANPITGYLAEIVVYNRAVIDSEATNVMSYLNSRYAIY